MSTTDPKSIQQVDTQTEPVPPVGEEIHLPGGSIIPLTVAFGTTLLVIGTTIWWGWSILGFIILVVSIGIWIRDVRRDVEALPEDHDHH
jgi:membrane protein required for beta-lactamase induction